MRGVLVLFVLLICAALVVGDRFQPHEYESSFSDWMGKHGKIYPSHEFQKRFEAYKNNMDFVDEFNARNESFTVGLNVFADLNVADFTALHLSPMQQDHRDYEVANFTGEGVKIPRANVDWRTSGAVTAIKDQKQCGSCWTFSAAGAIESAYKISTGNLVALSEQQLLDCTPSQNGCNGGSFTSAYKYVISNGGLDTMASYPYTAAQGTCQFNAANVGATITSWQSVAPNDESAMVAAVNQQPISVGIRGDTQAFQLYRSGTFNDAGCTATPINHAVIAIGYGTDTNGDYWLLKNSWGTTWGLSGFAQMKRGVNMCGISSQPAFPSRQSIAGWIWQDSLFSGWGLMYSGTVSAISFSATGNPGYAISASIAVNSRLMLASSPAASTSGFTKLSFSIYCSAATTVTYSLASVTQKVSATTTWQTVSTAFSSLGSPATVQYVTWINTGTAQVTCFFDNVRFM